MSKDLKRDEAIEFLEQAIDFRGRELSLRGFLVSADKALTDAQSELDSADAVKPNNFTDIESTRERVKNNEEKSAQISKNAVPDPKSEPWWDEYVKTKAEKLSEPFSNPVSAFFGVMVVSAFMFCIPYAILDVLICWIFGLWSSYWTVFLITVASLSVVWGLWAAIEQPKEVINYTRKKELIKQGDDAVAAYDVTLSSAETAAKLDEDTAKLLKYIAISTGSAAKIDYLTPLLHSLREKFEIIELKSARFFMSCELLPSGYQDFDTLVYLRTVLKHGVTDTLSEAIRLCEQKRGPKNDSADSELLKNMSSLTKISDGLGVALRQVSANIDELSSELFRTLNGIVATVQKNEDKSEESASSLAERYSDETVELLDGVYNRYCC